MLFLGSYFGLPVIASDVGSLAEDIIEERTGYVCPPRDSAALAGSIQRFFASDLYRDLAARRLDIRTFATERYSWSTVSSVTTRVYCALGQRRSKTTADDLSTGLR